MGKNLKIRKNLLRIFFSSALLFAISALQAQVCTNWTVKIDSIDNTCWANGQIKVTAHGPDVDDGALNNYRYTLYQNGEPFNGSEMTIAADPLTPHIQTFLGLPDGTYDIKVQAFCVRENTDTGTEPGRNESWFKATVKGTGWTKPTIDANATAGYQAMPCFPLGQITLKSIVAKTFPVKVKMVLAPNEYDINERYKDSIIYFSNTTNPSTITIDSLPAGDYRFMVYDGCNWDEPSSLVTVGTYGKNFPDQFFSTNNYFSYQGIYPVESSYFSPIKTGMGCNVIKVRKLFSSDLYNLQSKLLPLMEYTLLYPSETPNASSVWKSFDMTTTGDILELRHTLKEVHEATNKLTVLPKMAVRYKDGGCYGEYKVYNLPSFSTPPSLRSFDGNYGS